MQPHVPHEYECVVGQWSAKLEWHNGECWTWCTFKVTASSSKGCVSLCPSIRTTEDACLTRLFEGLKLDIACEVPWTLERAIQILNIVILTLLRSEGLPLRNEQVLKESSQGVLQLGAPVSFLLWGIVAPAPCNTIALDSLEMEVIV